MAVNDDPLDQIKRLEATKLALIQENERLQAQMLTDRQFLADWQQRLEKQEKQLEKREMAVSIQENRQIRNSDLLNM